MGRATLFLYSDIQKTKAHHWINMAPRGSRVEFLGPQRSIAQNDHMWSALTDIAQQKDWHGVKLDTEDWKLLFMEALNRDMRMVPNLDGNGFVNLGRSSSKLSKSEMSDLIELIYAWGAQNGVTFATSKRELPDNDSPPLSSGDAGAGEEASPHSNSPAPVDDLAGEEEGSQVASFEPDMTATSDPVNSGGGDPETPPPYDPRLKDAARDLFSFSTLDIPEAAKRMQLKEAIDFWKGNIWESDYERLEKIFMSAQAIMKGKVERLKTIAYYAEMLDCPEDDLDSLKQPTSEGK